MGFTAAIKSVQYYGSGDTIEFPMVKYNDGGHFKPATNRYSVKYIYTLDLTHSKQREALII